MSDLWERQSWDYCNRSDYWPFSSWKEYYEAYYSQFKRKDVKDD